MSTPKRLDFRQSFDVGTVFKSDGLIPATVTITDAFIDRRGKLQYRIAWSTHEHAGLIESAWLDTHVQYGLWKKVEI
jgi:hypothetical protein